MNEIMKKSGIEWIGEIPESWSINKIKYLAILKGRIGWQGLTSEEYQDDGAYLITGTDFLNGTINWESCVRIPEGRWEEAKDIQIENGDLLITKDGTVGKVAIVEQIPGKTSLNSGVLRISTYPEYDRKFLFWVLQSSVFWGWFNYRNAGNSTIIHLYQKDFGEFKYAYPPFRKQQEIAKHLDIKCLKISNVISALERQIELLQDYKKSLISETVTKGLNPDALMKDSGIEWIGEIPEHWQVIPLKYISECNRKALLETTRPDYAFRYVDISSVDEQRGITEYQEVTFENSPSRARRILEKGDIIISTVRTYLRAIALVCDSEDVIASTGFAVFTPSGKMDSSYLYFYFLSEGFIQEINKLSYGVSYPAINTSTLCSIAVTIPPLKEQKNISAFLKRRCDEIDKIISGKKQQIEKQKEYKQSLIYEYVTGKKHVREVN
jgi:type I restriction enzyme S subunit